MESGKYITINQLYSKYVFAQDITETKKFEDGIEYYVPQTKKILISFDEISVDSLNICGACLSHSSFKMQRN